MSPSPLEPVTGAAAPHSPTEGDLLLQWHILEQIYRAMDAVSCLQETVLPQEEVQRFCRVSRVYAAGKCWCYSHAAGSPTTSEHFSQAEFITTWRITCPGCVSFTLLREENCKERANEVLLFHTLFTSLNGYVPFVSGALLYSLTKPSGLGIVFKS